MKLRVLSSIALLFAAAGSLAGADPFAGLFEGGEISVDARLRYDASNGWQMAPRQRARKLSGGSQRGAGHHW